MACCRRRVIEDYAKHLQYAPSRFCLRRPDRQKDFQYVCRLDSADGTIPDKWIGVDLDRLKLLLRVLRCAKSCDELRGLRCALLERWNAVPLSPSNGDRTMT